MIVICQEIPKKVLYAIPHTYKENNFIALFKIIKAQKA